MRPITRGLRETVSYNNTKHTVTVTSTTTTTRDTQLQLQQHETHSYSYNNNTRHTVTVATTTKRDTQLQLQQHETQLQLQQQQHETHSYSYNKYLPQVPSLLIDLETEILQLYLEHLRMNRPSPECLEEVQPNVLGIPHVWPGHVEGEGDPGAGDGDCQGCGGGGGHWGRGHSPQTVGVHLGVVQQQVGAVHQPRVQGGAAGGQGHGQCGAARVGRVQGVLVHDLHVRVLLRVLRVGKMVEAEEADDLPRVPHLACEELHHGHLAQGDGGDGGVGRGEAGPDGSSLLVDQSEGRRRAAVCASWRGRSPGWSASWTASWTPRLGSWGGSRRNWRQMCA